MRYTNVVGSVFAGVASVVSPQKKWIFVAGAAEIMLSAAASMKLTWFSAFSHFPPHPLHSFFSPLLASSFLLHFHCVALVRRSQRIILARVLPSLSFASYFFHLFSFLLGIWPGIEPVRFYQLKVLGFGFEFGFGCVEPTQRDSLPALQLLT